MHGIHNVRVNVVNVGIAISVQSQKNEELRKRPNDIDVSLDNINSLNLLDAVNYSLIVISASLYRRDYSCR